MNRDSKRRDLAPDFDGHPSPLVWVEYPPTLRLDDAGRAAAARHIREGREQGVREFER